MSKGDYVRLSIWQQAAGSRREHLSDSCPQVNAVGGTNAQHLVIVGMNEGEGLNEWGCGQHGGHLKAEGSIAMRRTRKSATKGSTHVTPATSTVRSGLTTIHVCSPAINHHTP